jgi:putative ABC transport system permease protein
MWARFRSWTRALTGRTELESEMDAEMRFHIDTRADELLRDASAAGGAILREEALRRARLEFGGVEKTKEECRDSRGIGTLETLGQDLKYGARVLRKNPGFTVVAVLTLALGIGANSAIFSLVNGILLRPLPFPHSDKLVDVTGTYPKGAFVAMRERVSSIDAAAYAEGHDFNLTGEGDPQRLTGTLVSAEFFSVLGANAQLGRTFRPGEDRAGQDNFVVLSNAVWQRRFASDPSIIGRPISLEGVSRIVVGVMPPDFRFPSSKTEVWIPLHNDPRDPTGYWASDFLQVFGRLRARVPIERARTDVRMFQSHVGELFPWPMPASWNANISVVPLRNGLVSDVSGRLFLLLGAVGLILLIACVNVANLALSRAATREKEIAVRTAMGAARSRLVRQLLTESVLLAAIGGAAGVLLASGGLQILKIAMPANTPRLAEVQIDWRVMAFTAALAIVTGFLFGLAPALHSSRSTISESLGSASRGAAKSVSQTLRGTLATAEIALAVLLVIAAGLLIRSFWSVSHANPGFRVAKILTARVTPNEDFCSDAQRCVSFYREILRRVDSEPGIQAAAFINTLPRDGRIAKRSLEIEGRPGDGSAPLPLMWLNVVTPGYFHVMNIPVAQGRAFDASDETSAPVGIFTAATARHLWPHADPIGKHFRFSGETEWRTVIGVVSDVHGYEVARDVPDGFLGAMYVPYSTKATMEDGSIPADMTVAIESSLDDHEVQDILRRTVGSLNAEVPASDVKSMTAVFAESVAAPASTAWLFGAFAGVALLLGVIGVYGVLSFLVSKRTREIGIRMALGAQKRDVLWMVMREGLKYCVLGIAIGVILEFAAVRLLAGELYGVSPVDPLTFVVAVLMMGSVTMIACYIPTRRAMKVDPLIALRHE